MKLKCPYFTDLDIRIIFILLPYLCCNSMGGNKQGVVVEGWCNAMSVS